MHTSRIRGWWFVFLLLLLTVAAAPLPIGAVERWAWSVLAAIVGALGLVWAAVLVFSGARTPVHPRWILAPLAFLGLVIFWVGLQSSSLLPVGWRHPIWSLAADALGTDVEASTALSPTGVRDTLLRWASYAITFFLALQYGRDRSCARLAIWVVAGTAAVYAALAQIQQLLGLESFLWFQNTATSWARERQSAPFVNPNNFAAYVGLGVLVSLGVLAERLAGIDLSRIGARERLRRILEEGFAANGLFWLSLLVCMAGLLFSQSRGGLLAVALGAALLLSVMAGRRRASLRVFLLLCVGAGGLAILVFGAAFENLVGRFDDIDASNGRVEIYGTTLTAIASAPVTGYGLGSFEDVYRFYDGDPGFRPTRRAHNSYLENILELGIPAALLLYLALAWCAARCLLGAWGRRREAHYAAIGGAVTLQMGLHSAVDFPLQIPAIALTYFFLLGIAVAQSWSSRVDLAQSRN